jgi:RNase adapter protein RapZ
VELTVITGMSGAGKSYAIGAFEDAGWFCVDNLPPGLLPSLAELFLLEGSKVERAAVVCDVRGGVWFKDLEPVLDRVAEVGVRPRVVFLEASDEVLLNRFRETRRPHPLADGADILAGVARERAELADARERADVVIDTSALTVWDLRRRITEMLIDEDERPSLRVQFVSFGYKHGVPREADLLFDVRFLQNPHYVPGLRALTGLDAPVADFVAAAPGMDEFRVRLEALLDFLLPAYRDEGKTGLVIGIGCTGGRHRSVAIAEMLTRRYVERGFEATASHRHLPRPAGPTTEAVA